MKTLLLFAVLAAVLLLINLSMVTFSVWFCEGFSLRVGYLFFHYTVFPRPPKKGKKKTQEETRPAGQPEQVPGLRQKIRGLLQKRGLSGFLSALRETACAASGTAQKFFSHFHVGRFLLSISVGGGDAAQTAVEYGLVCAAVGTAAGAILSQVKCRKWSIRINPDFSGNDSSVRFEMKAGIRLIFLIAVSVYGLVRFAGLSKKLKKQVGA